MKQIGKGSFSTVYKKNDNTVLIKSNDYVKESLNSFIGCYLISILLRLWS